MPYKVKSNALPKVLRYQIQDAAAKAFVDADKFD